MQMMMLGTYQFSLNTAAYQAMSREAEYRWPSQDRFGQGPVLQFTGAGAETISLPGVVYPFFKGGLGQVAAMRAEAAKGEPLQMIDGFGNLLGRWVIDRVTEEQSTFAPGGIPHKQAFTLTLRRYFEADAALEALYTAQAAPVPAVLGSAPVPATPATGTTAERAAGLASTTADSARSVMGAASAAYDRVAEVLAPGTQAATDALGAIGRVASGASDLLFVANRVRAIAGKGPINTTVISATRDLTGRAGSVLTGVVSAGRLLRQVSGRTDATPAQAQACINGAAVADRAAGMCRAVGAQGREITQ